MNANNGKTSWGESILIILNWPGTFLSRVFWKFGKVDRCTRNGQIITFHKGLFSSRDVLSSEIKSWSLSPEMGFDIIHIELTNGEVLTWIDKYNDSIANLRAVAADREIS